MTYMRDLFGILFSGQLEGKYMGTMYGGFMDDSADRNRERVVISAVLIGDFSDWKYLTKAFNKRLKQDGLEYFKSSHCNHLQRQFFKFRSLPAGREAADSVRADLDRIIKKSKAVGVGVVIPIPLFRKMKGDPRYAPFIPNDPYEWAVQSAWNESVAAVLHVGRDSTLTLAHDSGSNFHVLHKIFLEFKAKNPIASRVLRDFVPLDDKQNPPIQAADILADVTFRYAEEWAVNPTTENMRRLRGNMHKVCIWDESYAVENLEQMIKSQNDTEKSLTEAGNNGRNRANNAGFVYTTASESN
jgi:hypothetical protein